MARLFDDIHDPFVRDIVGVSEPVVPLAGDYDDGLVDEAGHYVDSTAEGRHETLTWDAFCPVYARRFDFDSPRRGTLGWDTSIES